MCIRDRTRAALGLCGNVPASRKQHVTVDGAGHYGIFSGKRWRGQVYPQVRDFIAAHARAPKKTAKPATTRKTRTRKA